MRHSQPALAALFAVAYFFEANGASADCAAPRDDYVANVNGNQVTICTQQGDGSCPRDGGMLRVSLSDAGNTIEKLPDFCQSVPSDPNPGGTGCYIDECVPPGTYQYGYATPLDCFGTCAGESDDYAIQVSVLAALSDCISDAGALTTASSLPWNPSTAGPGLDSVIVPIPSCVSASPQTDGGPVEVTDASPQADSGPVEATDASPQADSGPPRSSNDAGPTSDASDAGNAQSGAWSGGCTVVNPRSAEHTVLAIDAFALAFGIVVMVRRRHKRST